jgi:acetyltransferase-like isoleucine patch superfamily enzyme
MKMGFLERMYRSPFGRVMSFVAHRIARIQKPFIVYGYYDYSSGSFRKYTRMSSTVTIMNRAALSVGDHVSVWHYSILDASEGIIIGEGCQIDAWVGIFTHGSRNSIRLLGKQYVHIPKTERKGYIRGKVEIGVYTYIGVGVTILPGVKVGKGCILEEGALVNKDIPDYSIVAGIPCQIKGSTINTDAQFFKESDFSDTYYDSHALAMIKRSFDASIGKK